MFELAPNQLSQLQPQAQSLLTYFIAKTMSPQVEAPEAVDPSLQRMMSNANTVPWSEVTDLQSASVVNGPALNPLILQQIAAERQRVRKDRLQEAMVV